MSTLLRRLLHLVLFCVGLFGAADWLRSREVLPFWGWTRNKLGHLREHLDDYDTLFLGSSRMHYGLIPQRFDARMRELGGTSKSYSLALSGQRPHGMDEFVHWLLLQKPTKLRRVVIELCCWELNVREGDWMAAEEIEMRTARSFTARARTIVAGHHPWPERCAQMGHHVLHTLTNLLRIGQGARILQDVLAARRGVQLPKVYALPDEGFECIEATQFEHQKKGHAAFAADRKAFDEYLQLKLADMDPSWLQGAFDTATLRAQAAALRAAGIEPTYVVLPNIAPDFFGRMHLRDVRGELTLLELDVPQDNRPLYEFGDWWDNSHVMRSGAERLSSYLAERLRERETLRPGERLPPRRAPDAPPRLVVERRADGAPMATATGLPFVGQARVLVSTARGDSKLGDGFTAQVAMPAGAIVDLPRTGLDRAAGPLDLAGLPAQGELHAQLVVVLDGRFLAAGDAVRLDAPR